MIFIYFNNINIIINFNIYIFKIKKYFFINFLLYITKSKRLYLDYKMYEIF